MFCLLAGAQILGGNMDDAVGVDIKGNFDLRHAAGSRRDTGPDWKRPRVLLSAAISRSPCSTWTSTEVWPSAAVEKIWLFLVGMVVLRSMILVHTPPRVSMPRDSGVTSSSSRPLTSPPRTPPWMAAPMATHSSGLMPLKGSLPVKLFDRFLHRGNTGGTAHQQYLVNFGGFQARIREAPCAPGPWSASTRSAVSSLNFARVRVISKCLGPVASAVMKGRLILAGSHAGKLDLGLFRSFFQPLHGHLILATGQCRWLFLNSSAM